MRIIPYSRPDPETQPASYYPPYRSTVLRSPRKPLVVLPHTLSEITGPVYGDDDIAETDSDLTRQHAAAPLGERIVVRGQVLDDGGHPLRKTLVEIWQANSSGRYFHDNDQHSAPLDPNFTGAGRTLTDESGFYEFVTIRPGAYPWRNHDNAWRPAHIHFSLFGPAFATRLVTQMYFPGDPLFEFDPIFQSVPKHARELLISKFRMDWTDAEFALAYEFNIVLNGKSKTPFETGL